MVIKVYVLDLTVACSSVFSVQIMYRIVSYRIVGLYAIAFSRKKQESPANAKGTRDSSACMKAHCEQM